MITYNSLMSVLGKGLQPDKALALLKRRMQAEELRPDDVTSNACIGACTSTAGWCRAVALVTEMRSCSMQPNVIKYNSLIRAVGKRLQPAKALALHNSNDNNNNNND